MNKSTKHLILAGILASLILMPGCDSTSTVKTFQQKLQDALDTAVAANEVKGAAVAVIDPVQGTWVGVSGDSDSTTPIDAQMLFGTGNITETYIAACILKMAEQGQLGLDQPLSTYLPTMDYVDGAITLRQLLNHTSGVSNYVNHTDFWTTLIADKERAWTPEELLTSFLLTPVATPGTGFSFAHTNYLLLGMVITKVTGNSLSTELRQRFFTPQNLAHTYLAAEETMAGNIAHGWMDTNDDAVLEDISSWPHKSIYTSLAASAGIFATAEDTATWLKALLEGKVINEASLTQMRSFSDYENFGLGLVLLTYNYKVLWAQTGGTYDFNSIAVYEPESKVAIAVLLNQQYEYDPYAQNKILSKILEVVYSE